MINYIETPLAPKAVGTYSQGVFLNGVKGLYLFSGQIALHPETGQMMNKGIEEEIQQILSNIDGLLKAEKLTRKNIAKTTIFLTDLTHFSKVNEAYENYFEQPYPARSCLQVSALPKGATIEIEVIACPS